MKLDSNQIRIETVHQRYGVDNVSQLEAVQKKRRAAFAKKRNTIVWDTPCTEKTIDADKLKLLKLNLDFANDWLNKHHPLKAPRGTVLALGLCDEDTLYCIMTFKKSRNKQYYSELSRMWMLPGVYVKGGYQRISQYASELCVYNIVAYVYKSFEDVEAYKSIGMRYARSIQKTKWWIRGQDMLSDASRRQKHLTKEEMNDQGFISVYDLGVDVYVC